MDYHHNSPSPWSLCFTALTFMHGKNLACLPWWCIKSGNMAAEMEDFGTFVTAKQLSSILAHSTPVLIGVLLGFWAFLCLLFSCGRWFLLLRLRLHACAIRKTSFGSGLDLTHRNVWCVMQLVWSIRPNNALYNSCQILHRYLQTELRHHPQVHPWWQWQAPERTFSFS